MPFKRKILELIIDVEGILACEAGEEDEFELGGFHPSDKFIEAVIAELEEHGFKGLINEIKEAQKVGRELDTLEEEEPCQP